jgi:tRNA nucleotidyltransferase (CCA-adding enzyme)
MLTPNILKTISKKLKESGAKAIIVGGSVRDYFLNLPIKDYDIEVYGLESIEELEKILLEYGSVSLVGKSFGVLKFVCDGEEYDFSFPRTERKVAKGHGGFEVVCSGDMEFSKASLRRDFTINAMGYDIEEGYFIDPFCAKEDMKSKTLRHINSDTFIEDPLRVYRAIQFCARFNYSLTDETFRLCKKMVDDGMLEELPKERVYMEFKKLLLKSLPKKNLLIFHLQKNK